MLKFETSAKYRREIKRAQKRGWDLSLMEVVIDTLIAEKPLDPKYHDHELSGVFTGYRECHIQNDWLLIYKIERGRLILTATRTGSHSDLFG